MKKIISLLIISQFFSFCLGAKPQEAQDKKEYLNIPFWEKFQDETLVSNILKGYENNLDLKIAASKIKESEKIVKMSLGEELPAVNFEGMLGRTFSSSDLERGNNNFKINSYQQTRFLLPLTVSYEIDIWGKNRLKTKSKKQSLKIIQQDEKTTCILLASLIAINYYNLIKTDKLIELENELCNLAIELNTLIENKQKHGLENIDNVLASKELILYHKKAINDLENSKEILENQLNYLFGDKLFSTVERQNFDSTKILDNIPNELNSSIILNRPDVISASENVIRANYDAKIAKKDILPSFTIMGTFGFNGYDNLSRIFGSHTGLADLWILPNFNIFDGGRKYNLMKLKKLELERAKIEYEKAVLASIQEVNDSLKTLKSKKNNFDISHESFSIQKTKAQLKNSSKNYGLASDIDTILYKQYEIYAQKKLVSDKIDCIIAAINLYKSVGGADFTLNL